MIFVKDANVIQWRKDSLLNKWCWNNWKSISKKVNLTLNLTPFIQINSKWITDLNVKCKTLKLFRESRRRSSGARVRQRVVTLDTKNMIHKRKKNIYISITRTAAKLTFLFCEKP